MKSILAIISALLLIGGCTMTEINTDNEEMETSSEAWTWKNKPSKGIVIIPTTTTNS